MVQQLRGIRTLGRFSPNASKQLISASRGPLRVHGQHPTSLAAQARTRAFGRNEVRWISTFQPLYAPNTGEGDGDGEGKNDDPPPKETSDNDGGDDGQDMYVPTGPPAGFSLAFRTVYQELWSPEE